MLILLSHFTHANPKLEQATAPDVTFHVQKAATAAANPVPSEVRAKVDAILHFAANTAQDEPPDAYPNCRAILRSGVGFDRLDVKAWGARGVPVFNIPDYGTSEVADHALALMLALTRGTASYHDKLRAEPERNWHHSQAPVVRRLRGSVFGVVGLGRIGLAAALRARAFGMQIAFFDPYLPSGMEIAVGAARFDRLEDLMKVADVISVHTPSNEETRGLISRTMLSHAKRGLIVINTARGVVVDLDALGDALRDGQVAAAGLDVLPKEPADRNHPLIKAWLDREPWLDGRLTLSPHAAFYSPASIKDMRVSGVKTLVNYLTNGSLRSCVNLEYLKPRGG